MTASQPSLRSVPDTPGPASSQLRTEAFSSSLEHLLAELERVDLLIRVEVWRARQVIPAERFRGLTISDADIDAVLGPPLGRSPWSGLSLPPELEDVPTLLARRRELNAQRQLESARLGIPLRLARLAEAFELSPFDQDVLLIALAPELDLRYERAFAYLHDDVNRRRPSVDLTLGLLCPSLEDRLAARARFAPDAPLLRHGLVHLFSEPLQPHVPLLAQCIKLDERIVAFLHDEDGPDPRLSPYAFRVAPEERLTDLLLPAELSSRLARLAQVCEGLEEGWPVVYLRGGPGSGRQTLAGALGQRLKRALLVVDGAALAGSSLEVLESSLRLALREMTLAEVVVYWEGFDALLTPERKGARDCLLRTLERTAGLVFLSGQAAWDPGDAFRSRHFLWVDLEMPETAARTELWSRALGQDASLAEDVNLEQLSERFRFTPGQIRDAAGAAIGQARWRDFANPRVTMADLWEACRKQGTPRLGALARKVPLVHTWNDLVLSDDRLERLRELGYHARYQRLVLGDWGFGARLSSGKGLSALFTGGPGTGKTMAAGVVARELELDLYQIDLSTVVSKYIGETEKNLARIFDEAEASHAVLFFDEADALFGKRSEIKDAHDRYANLETSYLLQRMEAYQGIVILASNFPRNLDEAFLRRIRFILEFASPDERERRRIWEQLWPEGVPRDSSLDLAVLARKLEVSGGYLRNIALSAAFLAAAEGTAVGQRHVMHAARREYQKLGKVLDERG